MARQNPTHRISRQFVVEWLSLGDGSNRSDADSDFEYCLAFLSWIREYDGWEERSRKAVDAKAQLSDAGLMKLRR